MCRHLLVLTAVASFFPIVAAGCGNSEKSINAMTLYSLDGEYLPDEGKAWRGEMFHGYPVLAKTEIESPSDRLEILTAVKQGIAQFHDHEHTCFWPHHGVSLLQGGKRIDYVICFHCLQLEQYVDGVDEHKSTSDSPATVLNSHLAKAGISVKN